MLKTPVFRKIPLIYIVSVITIWFFLPNYDRFLKYLRYFCKIYNIFAQFELIAL